MATTTTSETEWSGILPTPTTPCQIRFSVPPNLRGLVIFLGRPLTPPAHPQPCPQTFLPAIGMCSVPTLLLVVPSTSRRYRLRVQLLVPALLPLRLRFQAQARAIPKV